MLTKRDKLIMNEAFMVGRIYATNGEKESQVDIYHKLERACIGVLSSPAKSRNTKERRKTVLAKRPVQHAQPKICQHHRYGTQCVFNREWNGIKIRCSHKPCAVKLPAGA